MTLGRTVFETALAVRPDDIDMNQHVHASRYQDYLMAARYDQMERCYGMSMDAFVALGFGWFVHSFHIDYKRALKMGDRFRVLTWVEEFLGDGVVVRFEMKRDPGGKSCCSGWSRYTLIQLASGRASPLPPEIIEKYAV